ncbi:hypothetical protein [Peptococcus niger]|uniref:Uncharacterized protein n=1 Tax=Peptococcus niger TaxID=2741 RepID=A0A1G6TBQ6_PEPNI|nr:hypothetical protein [Peptococcus niger]SDD25976.1 hypothetical protein SAMN04489866_102101 [Peptococcus niger]
MKRLVREVGLLYDLLLILTLSDVLFMLFVRNTLSQALLQFKLEGLYFFYLQFALPWIYIGTSLLLATTLAMRLGIRVRPALRLGMRLLALALPAVYIGVMVWQWQTQGDGDVQLPALMLQGGANWLLALLGLVLTPALLPAALPVADDEADGVSEDL